MRTLLRSATSPSTEVRFFASARSAGTTLPWRDGEIVVEDTDTADFTGLDLALVLQRQDRLAGHCAPRSPPPVPS